MSMLTASAAAAQGYWLVGGDGGVFAFGDASFFGSLAGVRLNRPVVGIAATPTGKGYWLVAGDGGVFSFGDASFEGSTGGCYAIDNCNVDASALAPTPSGKGYWIAFVNGAVFPYGDAGHSKGDAQGALSRGERAVAVASAGSAGYWVATDAGRIFSFGDAQSHGDLGAVQLNRPVVALAGTNS
jgi:hypothetical protein